MVPVSEITRLPTRTGTAIALSAAGLATLALAFTTTVAALAGLVGTVLLAAGLTRGSRRFLDTAGSVFFLALLAAGVSGSGLEALLLGGVASILAWDTAENALSVGGHLGRETDTTRLEVVHAATTLLVLTVGVAIVYVLGSVASGGQPVAAVVLLLVGVIALVAAVRR
ncbi:hypothetical protein GJR96_02165 [Haloferax sp. MBLA0076]|uniref:Uncharacterized protein n=1 Tax=Haloferax litoreum TaxID=2666140 RepID=A0A6A8GCB7_9EURY|nr:MULTISPECIES: hypothetical protein [Haloferax]KAB1192309.1 hypothetical protein Hfx1148_02150 [Haloferax sp. CBA1148]MRX20768.1 hypothetical protein [Haloferax litoreum]